MSRHVVRGVLVAVLLTLAVGPPALGQDASTAPSVVASPVLIDPLDPRGGGGANRVGAPLLALLAVILAGAAAAGAAYLYVRVIRRA